MADSSDSAPSTLAGRAAQSWARLRAWSIGLWPRPEVRLLVGVLVVLIGVWIFIELADEVMGGDIRALDQAVLLSLRDANDRANPLGPPWVEEMMRDWTALGSMAVIWFLTAGGALYLFIAGRRVSAILLVVTVCGAVLLNVVLKMGFDRPRPDLVPHGMHVYQASFPSGHSMTATAVYLSLGILAARLQRRRSLAFLITAFALLISLLVGISRVYLGVHWPSDVVAGWIAGAVWALLCGVVVWWLRASRHERHKAPDPDDILPAKSLPDDAPLDKALPDEEAMHHPTHTTHN